MGKKVVTIKFCDKCGKEFNKDVITINALIYNGNSLITGIDLCSECYRSFRNWLSTEDVVHEDLNKDCEEKEKGVLELAKDDGRNHELPALLKNIDLNLLDWQPAYSNYLKKYLEQEKISQHNFAELTGIPQATISRLVSGERYNIHQITIDRLVKFFNDIC